MELLLVRHGRPDEADEADPGDPSLNAQGREQASAIGALLANEHISRLVSSPQRRARETAAPAARLLNSNIEIIDGWAEIDRGVDRYRSPETLREQGGDIWRRFTTDPFAYFGVDRTTFQAAVMSAYAATIRDQPPDAKIAVFSHGLPIKTLLAHCSNGNSIPSAISYGSITRLRLSGGGNASVLSVNNVDHLI